MSLISALIFLGILGILVLVYDVVLRAIFFQKSVRRAHPFRYWWDRLTHHRK